MTWLLDTNVVSELRRPRADRRVVQWAERQDPLTLHISVVTVLEIERGVMLKERADAAQGVVLRRWLEDAVLPAFDGRILAVDTSVARAAARLHVPDPRPERDALIAGTALASGLTVVSRNVGDFPGVPVHNPWAPAPR